MKINTTLITLCFVLTGCAGFIQDNFQGVLPTARESWDKPNISEMQKKNDIGVCTVEADRKFPNTNQYKDNFNYYENCMLDKGYKFYPRGLKGDKASLCQGSSRNSPACASVR